jgi:farnesyl diphosphate synthase
MPVETVDRLAQELEAEAARVRADVDDFFANLLGPSGDGRERLYKAVRHAALGGGKRLRPLLTVAASRLFAIDRNCALRVGCAIEAIHVYSLIHDDLPCMDDADLRRGKPSWPGTACTRLLSKFSLIRRRTRIRGSGPTSCSSLRGRRDRRAWPEGR